MHLLELPVLEEAEAPIVGLYIAIQVGYMLQTPLRENLCGS